MSRNTVPHLDPAEWQDVRDALNAIADCGCRAEPRVARTPGPLSAIVDKLIGAPRPTPELSPRDVAVLRFMCDAGRVRHPVEDQVPALIEFGFSRAQIDAMALLAA